FEICGRNQLSMARQRSSRAHEQVIEAAIQLFAERGIDRTSMDAIAEASGVSKATIYKHWADKEALVLEVMVRISGLKERPVFDSGNFRNDLIAVLSYRPREGRDERAQQIMPHLIAYSAHNQKFGQTWRETVMEPPRREIKQILKRAKDNGELAGDLDLEFSPALLLGPMLYNKIFGSSNSTDNKKLARRVVESFWRSFARKT
ncbi:MAG TPA: TetR/AcrR family transcriptional regulator, partial [Bryobacteraceae bacterium]